VQAALQVMCGTTLVDLHVSDLINNQLPSHYDYTSQYDILVFRRLAAGHTDHDVEHRSAVQTEPVRRGGPPVLRRIDTNPVGFAVFDRVLLTVHPAGCGVLDQYAARLLGSITAASRAAGVNLPAGPADLMLRIVNQMVDGYLDLRRELTRQLDHWQSELLHPKARFNNWGSLLDARISLHHLDEICEDQRSAIQDWMRRSKAGTRPTRWAEAGGWSCSRCAAATCWSTSNAWCTTCAGWSRTRRPPCRCTSRRRATAPTTSCAR